MRMNGLQLFGTGDDVHDEDDHLHLLKKVKAAKEKKTSR